MSFLTSMTDPCLDSRAAFRPRSDRYLRKECTSVVNAPPSRSQSSRSSHSVIFSSEKTSVQASSEAESPAAYSVAAAAHSE